jgi:hypothetical protein
MSDRWRPITVRDVQAAISLEGVAGAIVRDHIARVLNLTDRELDLLVAEQHVLDVSAYAYLAEHDLEGAPGARND